MSVTIKEIAKELGLHPSTVSRALSGSNEVSDATREKVLELTQRWNYSPNLMAKNLVSSNKTIIGCLVLDYSNPFFIPMIRAIGEIAAKNNYIVFFGESQRSNNVEKQAIEQFRQIQAAGVILTPVLKEIAHLNLLQNENTPVIIAGRKKEGFNCVDYDNEKAGYLAGEHLLQMGHKRFGFVRSGEENNFPEQERLKGYKKAVEAQGYSVEYHYVVDLSTREGGERAADMWFDQSNRPTAVFCSIDLLAIGFLQRLMALGVDVPNAVAVVGHDDIPFADIFSIPLTTVAYPKYKLGSSAIELLLSCLNDDNKKRDPQTIILEPKLVVRESSSYRVR